MNVPKHQPIPDVEKDYRVAALAKVNQMHDDLIRANEAIRALTIDLNRAHDRTAMMNEERDRYRHESLRLRRMLTELTTQMANIGLMTRRAEDYVATVAELDAAPTPTPAMIDELAADHASGKAPGALTRMPAEQMTQLGAAIQPRVKP
jgi:hypothetical protein